MNLLLRLPRASVATLVCVLASACSSSSSTEEPNDAGHGHDASSNADVTSTATPDAGSDVIDAGAADVPVFALEAGTTWSSLYRDYFGPGGQASCAGDGNCHGGTMQAGYYSSGFLCPPGDASTACWMGITSLGDGGAYLIYPDAGFDADQLSMVLCQENGTGEMPFGCTYIFTPIDMQRIGDWVNAGALNN